MVTRCWDPNPERRPNFEEVVKTLDALIVQMPRETHHGGACCSVQ
jgi:hypothetical protein